MCARARARARSRRPPRAAALSRLLARPSAVRRPHAVCSSACARARGADHKTYQEILASLKTSQPRTGELMPVVYDCMVRMNDEDIRKEYITQMEIILNDDPNVSERIKGIAEGMSIKLGEMMDMPRHQRIAKARRPPAPPPRS